MFVSKEPVPVTVDGENIIYIRARMNLGIKNQVIGAGARLGKPGELPTLDLAAYNMALLTLNVLSWIGPAFEHTPCIPINIENLDDSDPLVEKVLAEIAARNKGREADDPNATSSPGTPASSPDGSAPLPVLDMSPSGTGTYISALPPSATGRRIK